MSESPPRWITNTSPIVFLGKLGLLDSVIALGHSLSIPSEVIEELRAGASGDPGLLWTASHPELVLDPIDVGPEIVRAKLGPGESAVIAVALQSMRSGIPCEIIVDDFGARRFAKKFGIQARGTLGILVMAREAGLIGNIGPYLDGLLSFGFRASSELIDEIRSRSS